MDEYTTVAVLKAKVGNYIAGFRQAAAEYETFQAKFATGNSTTESAAERSSSVVSKAFKIMGAGAVAAGVGVVKTGMDFQAAMSRVQAISGATKGQMKQLTAQAVELGAKTAFSAKEAAAGMENMASAGFSVNETMNAMPGVLDLAAVSGGDVGLAAENSATALRAFGLEASQAGHVADVFAKAAADTNAEATDMGEALKMVAPQAHAAGISLEETAAAIGIMSNSGIKGSQAGSNLAMAMTKLQNPSKEAKDAMAQLGFNAYDSAGKMKPLATQVTELKSKLAGMTDQQKQYYTSQIYGVQGGRAMNVLLSAQSGELNKLTNSLKNSDGAAQKMAETMQNNVKSSVEQFGGALESMAITLFNVFSGDIQDGVDSATKVIENFTKYVTAHESDIRAFADGVKDGFSTFGKFLPSIQQVGSALKVILPSLVAIEAFKGIGLINANSIEMLKTMQADLTLVKSGLNTTGQVATKAGDLLKLAFIKPATSIKNLTVSTNSFLNKLSAGSINIATGGLTKLKNGFSAVGSDAKKAGVAIGNAFVHPKTAITSLTGQFTKLKSGANTLGEAMKGKLANGINSAALGMGASTKDATALAAGLAPILPIALAVAAVATAIYVAWDSNFGNIRGVVESAINSIKGIIASMQPSINAIKTTLAPIAGLVKGIFAVVGVSVITALVGASISLATALRLIVDALGAIAQVVQSAYYGVKGFFEKLKPGGKDGAESMKKASKAMQGAGSSVKDMGSAFKDAWKSGSDAFGQFGKSADETKSKSDVAKVSLKSVGNAAKQMKADFERSKTDLSTLMSTDGVSDKTKQFLTSVSTMLDQYQSNSSKAASKYKKAMSATENETGDARIKAVNEANAKLASATSKNSKDLLKIHSDLDRQLKDQKFSDGTAMNADQVKLLTQQNEMVSAKLMEQNQIYVQAQMSRLKNGEKLNIQEQDAMITTLQSNYELQSQQITAGEQKIKALKDQIAKAKDLTTKAALQQELVDTQNHNNTLLQQQQLFGQQMNLTIANGQKLTYAIWSQGLSQMTGVTKEQLQQMFLSFVQMNGNTSQQMQAFAEMLKGQGIKGVDGLVKAMQDGKLTVKEAAEAMKAGGEEGLMQLPPSMFKNGEKGQKSFITALKKGDFKGAGKFLADETAKGADDKGKHGKSGKDNVDAYIKEIRGGKDKAKVAAKEVSKSSVSGFKSANKDIKATAVDGGKQYVSGIKSKESDAKKAGKGVGDKAKSGAASVKLNSTGSNMSAGLAAGIRANGASVSSAMVSVVNQAVSAAKRAADIHSPSRVFRDQVGKFISLGVATGIEENAGSASDAMANLVNGISKNVMNNDLVNSINGTIYTQNKMTIDDQAIAANLSHVQPVNVVLKLGSHEYQAYINDISHGQDTAAQLRLNYGL